MPTDDEIQNAAAAAKGDVLADPTVQSAIAAEVGKQMAGMMEQMEAMRAAISAGVAQASSPGVAPADFSKVMSDLAMSIAEMSNPGDRRAPVPPEEVAKRKAGAQRMGELLTYAKQNGLQAHYTVVQPTWLDGQLIQPWQQMGEGKWVSVEIYWPGPPSTALRPVNDVAKQIYDAFLTSIGGSTITEGLRDQPVWTTYGGLVMVGDRAPQSVSEKGNLRGSEPMTLGAALPTTNEITSTDDPNATRIPILGKTFAPAERTAAGTIPQVKFAK